MVTFLWAFVVAIGLSLVWLAFEAAEYMVKFGEMIYGMRFGKWYYYVQLVSAYVVGVLSIIFGIFELVHG